MGTKISRTPYDCNTSRRNQYNFIYRGNLPTGRLGKLSEFFIGFLGNLVISKRLDHWIKNFIRLENEHVGRTRERFKNSHRSVKKLPQLMTENANFIEHNFK